jgi:flagellar protein FliO/FliZ
MTQSLVLVGAFLAMLACLPFVLQWMKGRSYLGASQLRDRAKFISAVAVGPNQSVVTVEAGPDGARVWLTLGVTAQAITCLHISPIADSAYARLEPVVAPGVDN